MKKILKNQAGAVILIAILVIVIAAAGGGAAFLGVRSLVTGEPFLQPFEDLGWIELDDEEDEEDDDDKEEKKNKKSSDEDEDEDEDEDDEKEDKDETKTESKTSSTAKESRLSSESKKAGVDHYYGSMTMADSTEYADEEYAEIYKLLKVEVDIYAKDDIPIEIVFSVKLRDFMKKMYEEYGDDLGEEYDSYEEFEEAMMGMFETAFDFGFSQASEDNDMSKYVTKYIDDGDIQIYFTEESLEALYEEFDDEDHTVDSLIDELEESMGIEIKKV